MMAATGQSDLSSQLAAQERIGRSTMAAQQASQTDLDIGASSPTLPRIDSVIAEFVDNGGRSLYRIRVVAGTPNASPVQPTLPYADQPTGKTLRLYNVAVAALATTIVDANISKQASLAYLASSGRLQNVSSDGGRPSSPYANS